VLTVNRVLQDDEIDRISDKLIALQAEIRKPQYTKEQVVAWISKFKYGDVSSKEYQKRIKLWKY